MKKIIYLFVFVSFYSCKPETVIEKKQGSRDAIIDIKDRLKEIVIEEVLISDIAVPYILGEYLIIEDYRPDDKLLHFFTKKDFRYLSSALKVGQGPAEIASIGHIGINEAHRKFYVSDHGKQKIFSYNIDTILQNPLCVPQVKMEMTEEQFPSGYLYINDTLSIGLLIQPTSNSTFNQTIGKWDMSTGKVVPMPYTQPDIKRKRVSFGASVEDSIYAECYSYYDLMTICNFNGTPLYNIYGPNWSDIESQRIYHYGNTLLCRERILALYSGDDNSKREYYFTKILVFSLTGDYIRTLETNSKIQRFCYDKENDRLILQMNDEIQFAYLELGELIK